jgi:hypothetical protein
MPRISTNVSLAVKRWLKECARREDRSEAKIIQRVLEDAMAQAPDAASHDTKEKVS